MTRKLSAIVERVNELISARAVLLVNLYTTYKYIYIEEKVIGLKSCLDRKLYKGRRRRNILVCS